MSDTYVQKRHRLLGYVKSARDIPLWRWRKPEDRLATIRIYQQAMVNLRKTGNVA